MIQLTIITVGTLKESYWRDAVAEYEKRLGGFANTRILQLKESKLPEDPSEGQINRALEEEGKQILTSIPPRSYTVALCVEGKQFSSPALAAKLDDILTSHSSLCLCIGSSYGLAPAVKSAADLRLSVSELTFPHQMMRVILLESLYRAFAIRGGKKYHK